MALQDLEKFRDNGELSDISITVDSEEHKLHKFPLYIKSEYFKDAFKEGSVSQMELKDFPGGKDIFNLIADFCYNKRIDISLQNVAALRSGSEFLGMSGSGNLIELSDRYLQDVLNSAKISKSISPLVDILSQCSSLGESAENAKIAAKCFEAIMDIWVRPGGRYMGQHFRVDSLVTDKLLCLPLNWFIQLIKTCSDNEHQRRPLAELASKYLERVIQRELDAKQKEEKKDQESSQREVEDEQQLQKPEEEKPEEDKDEKVDAEKSEDAQQKKQSETEEKLDDADAGSDTEADAKSKPSKKEEPAAPTTTCLNQNEPTEPVNVVLDQVIMNLPEDTPLSEVITSDWIKQALLISDKYNCECRTRLLQLAGNILHRFSKDELKEMPSPVLCEIIENTVKCEKVVPEVLSCVIDNHLLDLAKNNELSVEDFIKLSKSVPDSYRTSHDTLFEVAEQILSSGETIPDDKQNELVQSIDLSRCHENTLQRALDKGIIPVKIICQAAIDLSKKLRQQVPDESRDDMRYKYVPSSSSYRRHEPNIRYHDPLSSPAAAYNAPDVSYPHSSYPSTYPSSNYGRYDDQSLSAFEDNLRYELSRISTNYENYFGDRGVNRERDYSSPTSGRSQYKSPTGRRW